MFSLPPRQDAPLLRRHATLALLAAVVVLTAACGNKKSTTGDAAGPGAAKPGAQAAAGLDRAKLGATQPTVDVLAFVGFECPHCRASADTLMNVLEANKQVMRLRIINLPLDVHPHSVALAKGFVAARRQGQWQSYWRHIFGLKAATEADVLNWASGVKLDLAKFKADLASAEVAAELGADAGLAEALGVAGTPSYLVNGALLQGARKADEWQRIIASQVALAADLRKKGTKDPDLLRALVDRNSPKRAPHYATLVLEGQAPKPAVVPVVTKKRTSGVVSAKLLPGGGGGGGGAVQLGGPRPGASIDETRTVWRVVVRPDDPVRGPKTAPLTVVVFSDYECPHCKTLQATLTALMAKYGKDLRIVHKHNPLPFHALAMAAAEAAEAARAQGHFWEMNDALFAAAPALKPAALSRIAEEIKLDKQSFDNAMSAHGARNRVQADMEQAAAVGARGTPNLFINGRKVVGAKTVADLTPLLDAELAVAKKLIADGTDAAAVYEKIVGEGRLLDSLAPKPVQIETAGAATRGAKGAAIHIVTFQDLQCPFCARLDVHIAAMEKEFDGRVKVTWMDFPLHKIHPQAQLAAEAGKEALAQGKFWPFHAVVMADQSKLDEAGLVALGTKAGLDTKKLRAALKSHKWAAAVAKEAAEAAKLGLKGTPSVFINGYAFTPQLGFSANTFRSAIRRLLGAR